MKKRFLYTLAAVVTLASLTACGDDDEPIVRRNEVTVTPTMLTHTVNTATGQVVDVANYPSQLIINTTGLTTSLQTSYSLDGTTTLTANLTGMPTTEATSRVYSFAASGNGTVNNLSGRADLNELAYKWMFSTGTYRVIAVSSEIFYLSTQSKITDNDSITSNVYNAYYQFEIDPAAMTATVKVMSLSDEVDYKFFDNITGYRVPVVATASGFQLDCDKVTTEAIYRAYDDETGSTKKKTDDYPFHNFHAVIDLAGDHFEASFKLGDRAYITAQGNVYNESDE